MISAFEPANGSNPASARKEVARNPMLADREPSEAELAYERCHQAQLEEEHIDHATAKTIAGLWARSWSTEEIAFTISGEIQGDPEDLWRKLAGRWYLETSVQHRVMLDMLGSYLVEREDRGPVENWGKLTLR
jgi:hypothetical protein